MTQDKKQRLLAKAKKVLANNDRGSWTVPAGELYPHQWLWDSCFISIGLRHLDVKRAQTELLNLLRGQWANGMLPNIIFQGAKEFRRHRNLWRSWVSPYAPKDVTTSGITQPPMLAEAVSAIGEKLNRAERHKWYEAIYPHLLRYHQWLYAERNPHQEGLIVLIHPYESGLDNSLPWISELRKHSMPWWVLAIEKLHLDRLVNLVRRDTRHVPPGQRMSNIEAMAYWAAIRRLRRKAYNSEAILSRSLFLVEDLTFNCILVRANHLLKKIAKEIDRQLPVNLIAAMDRTQAALDDLWDESSGQYFSRSFISHKLIEESTVSTLLALYSGAISKAKAQWLVELLLQPSEFGAPWPVPSVPLSSPFFDAVKYWQGPTWININWLIIKGLENYGFDEEAKALKHKTLELVGMSSMNEYFNPLNGNPVGAPNFSWTAALTIDLLSE